MSAVILSATEERGGFEAWCARSRFDPAANAVSNPVYQAMRME